MRLRSYVLTYFNATECNENQKHLPRLPTFMNYVQQLQLQHSCNNQTYKSGSTTHKHTYQRAANVKRKRRGFDFKRAFDPCP